MKFFIAFTWLMAAFTSAFCQSEWLTTAENKFKLEYTSADKERIETYIPIFEKGVAEVSAFFGNPFKDEFKIRVHPNRNSLDKQWQLDWNMPLFKSECWMVASGTALVLDIISPFEWKAQACEHNFDDRELSQQLITHEMVHVFHGQHNASPDFSETQGTDWFVEGLATYASGQCTKWRVKEVKASIIAGSEPKALDDFWKGKMRYGISGSLVMYIDETFGREKVNELLAFKSKSQILCNSWYLI